MSSARGMSGARLRTGWSRSRRTKVEKSLINFQDCHPNWHADGNAGKWLQQLDEYAQEQNNTRLRKQLDDSLFGSLSSSGIRECDTRMRDICHEWCWQYYGWHTERRGFVSICKAAAQD